MSRKVNLPGADALFGERTKGRPEGRAEQPTQAAAGPSGRVKHTSKITVYVTEDELIALEQARLQLRAEHGVQLDRGRLVREAIGLALADLDTGDSELVRRLTAE